MIVLRSFLFLSGIWFASLAFAEEFALYEPSDGRTPIEAGFFGFSSDVFDQSGFYKADAAFTTFDSTASIKLRAGYLSHGGITGNQFHTAAPVLCADQGFQLHWEMAILEEHHETHDTAGFSVLVLDKRGRGINLGFWKDRIWAYEGGEFPTLFAQSEHAGLMNSDKFSHYSIMIAGDHYTLYLESIEVLKGPVRDYHAWPGIAIPLAAIYDPYEVPNMIFFGDDTQMAKSIVQLGRIAIETALQSISTPSPKLHLHRGPNGTATLSWSAEPNEPLRLEVSQDLRNWQADGILQTDGSGQGHRSFQTIGTYFLRLSQQ